MDLTPLYHAVIAAAFWAIGAILGEPLAGATLGAGIFIGREHAQAEYRWIVKFAKPPYGRSQMPWWGGFNPRVWNIASLMDFIPSLILAIVVFILTRN